MTRVHRARPTVPHSPLTTAAHPHIAANHQHTMVPSLTHRCGKQADCGASDLYRQSQERVFFIGVVTIFVEIICGAATGGAVGARYLRIRRHEEIAIKMLHPQMKKCLIAEEILLQMPKVVNGVRIFWIFREMIIGALAGVLCPG